MLVTVGILLWVFLIIMVAKVWRIPYGARVESEVVPDKLAKPTQPSSTIRWAPIEPLSEGSEAEDDESEEAEEDEETDEATAEGEEEWENESSESDAPKKKKETCKMQFVILNGGPKNTKLQPGALCEVIANLSVQNIIKIRELDESETAADHRKEWLRAYRIWDARGVTKITLRCDSRESFDAIVAKAVADLSMPVSVKVIGPVTAVAAIGPVNSDALQELTGSLKLLS